MVNPYAVRAVLLLLLWLVPCLATAAEVEGHVESVEGAEVRLSLPASARVAVGDRVRIGSDLPGLGIVYIEGSWLVREVGSGFAIAQEAGAVGTPPHPGFTATIETGMPQGQPGTNQPQSGARPTTLVEQIQRELAERGYATGPVDGVLGPRTRAAISHYQRSRGLAVDGRPSEALLAELRTSRPATPSPPAGSPGVEQTSDADALYRRGDALFHGIGVRKNVAEGIRLWKAAAAQGQRDAQFNLGVACMYGDGVPRDPGEAARLWRAAAAHGHVGAAGNLGVAYQQGLGVPRDDGEAARLFRFAAEGGDAHAQYNLAQAYRAGRGVSKDSARAAEWALLSARQGDAEAQGLVGQLYRTGEGMPRDSQKAVEYTRQAAMQNQPTAQYNLGAAYLLGDGVAQDYAQALHWFERAAAADVPGACYQLYRMYHLGNGVPRNEAAATHWLQRAAALGHEEARQAAGLPIQ